MKIAVIGAGAMGSLFGFYLAGADNEVTLVDPWAEHVEAVNRFGLTVLDGDNLEKKALPRAVTTADAIDSPDLALFFVKAYHTRAAAFETAPVLKANTIVLTLQNGYGNVEILSEALPGSKVLAGSTAHGATVLAPGRIRHAGTGDTVIGLPGGGSDEDVFRVAALFNRCGLKTATSKEIDNIIWGKLIINAAINPLTALLKVTNGELLKSEYTLALIEMLAGEAAAVASRKGIRLPYADPVTKVKTVADATALNRSSMLQDIEKGRRTEIDFINGAVSREGRRVGLNTPYNEMASLLIKGLEEEDGA